MAARGLHPRRHEHGQHGPLRRDHRLWTLRLHGGVRSRHGVQLHRSPGRYAYGRQPFIAQWNLARFAEALLPLLDPVEEKAVELANDAIIGFEPIYKQHWLTGMRGKLGLLTEEGDDLSLIDSLLKWMQETQADFTNTFRLCRLQVPHHSPPTRTSSPGTSAGRNV
nr:protein adenylyltransferase SelO family protein [Verrucomicrobium spinosum]